MRHCRSLLSALAFGCALTASPASAQQVFESVGERALGMGGAFVAVADDSTSVYWNPAGVMRGSPAGMTIGWYRFQSGNHKAAPQPGPELRRGSLSSLGTWPLGLSYGSFRSSALVADAVGDLRTETLRTSDFGVTVLQQLVPRLVLGSTIKYVRGSVAAGPIEGDTTGKALSKAGDLKGDSRGAIDLDVGVMADFTRIRVGLTVRNLREPSFGDVANPANTLQRQKRLGVAFFPTNGLTLAMDVDLDTVDLRDGLRRMFAFGGEGRVGRRLAFRSGIRWNLEQGHRLVGSVGVSVSVRPGLWLDGHFAEGRYDEDRELGLALRAGF